MEFTVSLTWIVTSAMNRLTRHICQSSRWSKAIAPIGTFTINSNSLKISSVPLFGTPMSPSVEWRIGRTIRIFTEFNTRIGKETITTLTSNRLSNALTLCPVSIPSFLKSLEKQSKFQSLTEVTSATNSYKTLYLSVCLRKKSFLKTTYPQRLTQRPGWSIT